MGNIDLRNGTRTHTDSRQPNHRARLLRDLLRSRLLAAEFSGGRLPDEIDLMREYSVGRNVVRAALAELQREGLVRRTQGAGTFPLRSKARHTIEEAHGLGSSIVSPQTRMVTRVLSAEEGPASPTLAARLGVPAGATCLVVDSVASVDDTPVVVLTSYLADPDARGRVAETIRGGIWAGDWYDALAVSGLLPYRREVLVEAVCVDELVSPLLELPTGDPIMRFERDMSLGEEGVHEYGFSCCRGDLLAFVVSDGSLEYEGVV